MANKSNLTPFKKGQSGNPNGRPKKLPALDKLLSDKDDNEYQAVIDAIFTRAKKGDMKAAEILLNRAYGKPRENEGQPTEMKITVNRVRN